MVVLSVMTGKVFLVLRGTAVDRPAGFGGQRSIGAGIGKASAGAFLIGSLGKYLCRPAWDLAGRRQDLEQASFAAFASILAVFFLQSANFVRE